MSFCQINQPMNPKIWNPEAVLTEEFSIINLRNPLSFHGPIQTIKEKVSYKEDYEGEIDYERNYSFDSNKKLTDFSIKGNPVDDNEPILDQYRDAILKIKGDSVLHRGNYTFNFKNGKLHHHTKKELYENQLSIVKDSVVYFYEKEKLKEWRFYSKDIAEDYDSYELLVSDYALYSWEVAHYNDDMQFVSSIMLENNPYDGILLVSYQCQYKKKKLVSFTKEEERYDAFEVTIEEVMENYLNKKPLPKATNKEVSQGVCQQELNRTTWKIFETNTPDKSFSFEKIKKGQEISYIYREPYGMNSKYSVLYDDKENPIQVKIYDMEFEEAFFNRQVDFIIKYKSW